MRNLTHEEILDGACGHLHAEEEGGGLLFHRFPAGAYAFYDQSEAWAMRSRCPAGVKIAFRTDSPTVTVRGTMRGGLERFSGCIDLLVDGILTGSAYEEKAEGEWTATFAVPDVEPGLSRSVEILLPHVRVYRLDAVSLTKGSTVTPSPSRATWLAMGDSITQGMCARHPALTYPLVAARPLRMPVHNGGVGGMVFAPQSLVEPLVEDPDLVTVAYGTNDWTGGGLMLERAGQYLERLRELYPDALIVVLEPIWRQGVDDEQKTNRLGKTLEAYREELRKVVESMDGIHRLPSHRLLPPDPHLLTDGIHPGQDGHLLYGMQLAQFLKDEMDLRP